MLAKSFYGVRYSLIVVCIALVLEGIAARAYIMAFPRVRPTPTAPLPIRIIIISRGSSESKGPVHAEHISVDNKG
jgi:hypothetical protein